MSDGFRAEITETLMPDPPPRRSCSMQYSWKLFDGERCVARSYDYFPTEALAQVAYDEFVRLLQSAEDE